MSSRLLVVLALFFLPSLSPSAEEVNYINMYVRLDDQSSVGLDKLTAAERGRLNEVFKAITERLDDNLRNGALAYLRQQGWSELEVTGTTSREGQPGATTLVTARRSGQDYLLEPDGVSILMPGTYLARVDSGRCSVIDPQGRTVEFVVRQ